MHRKLLLMLTMCLLLGQILMGFTDGATHTIDNVLDFFPETDGDGLNVIWAHGVNSLDDLNETLADDTMMIETDIILRGIGTPNETDIPVHAHPPLTDSDLTLEHFLTDSTQYPNKGMKLDFKYLEALGPAMELVLQFESELKAPLWLNADIVIGPNSPRDPVPPQPFIDIANSYFDQTTLSLGFTTGWGPLQPEDRYTWTMIFDILYYSYPLHPQPVTYPIRAVWCKTSWPKFVWLLGLRESFSITVWSSTGDIVDVGGLVDLREYGDTRRIFYDLPAYQEEAFVRALGDPNVIPTPRVETPWNRDQWVAFENSDVDKYGRNFAFLSTDSLGISGNAPRPAIVHSRVQHMPMVDGSAPRMVVKGRVQFIERYNSTSDSTIEIYLRSISLLDDGEAREAVLVGNNAPSAFRYAISSNGTLDVNGERYTNQIPRADCYDFEINDHLDGSFQTNLFVRTCADAVSADPNADDTMLMTSGSIDILDDQEYYVIVTMLGGGQDVIVERLVVEGSHEPSGSASGSCCNYLLIVNMMMIVVALFNLN